MKLEAACSKLELTLSTAYRGIEIDKDANRPWDHHAYTVTLTRGAESFSTTYKQGTAHTEPPTLTAVVACLMSDASAGELGSFEEFCGDFGYDADSRRAESTYNACRETAAAMRRLLGEHFESVAELAQEY